MDKKIIGYIGLSIFLLILVIGVIIKPGNDRVIDQNKNNLPNPELEKYRSLDIPEACRLPEYEDNLDWWKEHLSHHKPTWYCLTDYYGVENVEEFVKGGNN